MPLDVHERRRIESLNSLVLPLHGVKFNAGLRCFEKGKYEGFRFCIVASSVHSKFFD